MSFREKSAWISFFCLLVVFTPFFVASYLVVTSRLAHDLAMNVAFALLAAFVALEVALHLAVALRAPKDARSPKDEREQLIEMRATRVAFPVLVLGALGGAAMLHVSPNAWVMNQVVLLAVVVAELVKFGTQIVLFRRGV